MFKDDVAVVYVTFLSEEMKQHMLSKTFMEEFEATMPEINLLEHYNINKVEVEDSFDKENSQDDMVSAPVEIKFGSLGMSNNNQMKLNLSNVLKKAVEVEKDR